ncbi:hypothetical protein E4P40_03325 [Blastococcus sp. CT_GayMR20]|uniref:hypothetical protein n=1 Tax=Blastococcus sp. CT_GayMR20 TaxID=2559609 RepID=UPI0010731A0F|nr:hypothetical protein [Blastococcus sp. CT_GayMR20]TFV92244.1 hypothetical protein E4P40_03325 [Blastococcus sp. CT_GayMR20]
MRRTLTTCRDGLAVTAAAVLLTACGGSGDDEASSTSSAGETTSASESSADAADSEFCTEAAAIQERVGSTFDDQADPAGLPQALTQAAEEVRQVEPPAEIASDWAALADGIDQIAAAIASVDFNDPNAAATFEQQVAPLQQELAGASANVSSYLQNECGLEVDPSETAAPTS